MHTTRAFAFPKASENFLSPAGSKENPSHILQSPAFHGERQKKNHRKTGAIFLFSSSSFSFLFIMAELTFCQLQTFSFLSGRRLLTEWFCRAGRMPGRLCNPVPLCPYQRHSMRWDGRPSPPEHCACIPGSSTWSKG